MTPLQVFTIAAIGGIAGPLGLALVGLAAAALYAGIGHLFEKQQEWRDRRTYLREVRDLPTAQPRNHT
jgi:hypothetical protein